MHHAACLTHSHRAAHLVIGTIHQPLHQPHPGHGTCGAPFPSEINEVQRHPLFSGSLCNSLRLLGKGPHFVSSLSTRTHLTLVLSPRDLSTCVYFLIYNNDIVPHMSGNGHATYFGQVVVSEGEGTQHESSAGLSDLAGMANTSSQMILTGTTGGQSSTLSTTRPGSHYSIPSMSVESSAIASVFRTSLISKMDSLIQNFWMNKSSQSETLY